MSRPTKKPKIYVIYSLSTGVIRCFISCLENEIEGNVQAGESYVLCPSYCHDPEECYVDLVTNEAKKKPEMPITINKTTFQANGIDELVISGIPNKCPNGFDISSTIQIVMQKYKVTDGVFEFSTDVPLRSWVFCTARNYLDKSFIVEAIDES